MKKVFLLTTIISTGLIWGCTKKSNPDTVFLDYTKYSLAGAYKVTDLSFRTSGEDVIEYNVFNLDTIYKACKKDDILVFDTNNVFTYIDSTGNVCDSADKIEFNNYTITNTNLLSGVRTFEPAMFGPQTYLMQSLSVNKLILARPLEIPFMGNIISGTMKVTLTKQP
jgi:hypothetical protein